MLASGDTKSRATGTICTDGTVGWGWHKPPSFATQQVERRAEHSKDIPWGHLLSNRINFFDESQLAASDLSGNPDPCSLCWQQIWFPFLAQHSYESWSCKKPFDLWTSWQPDLALRTLYWIWIILLYAPIKSKLYVCVHVCITYT